MNKTILYFKNNPFMSVLLIVIFAFVVAEITNKAVSGLFGTSSNIVEGNANKPVLEKFTLNESKSIYVEKEIVKFGKGARVKTFIASTKAPDTNSPPSSTNHPVFDVVIYNPASEQLLISKIIYNIDDIGQVLGVGPGPVDSKYQYTSILEYKKGVQEYELDSPIIIPAQSSASFELAMFTEHSELGLSWWTNIEFDTDKGNVSTDMFQVILSGRPKWALKVLEPKYQQRLGDRMSLPVKRGIYSEIPAESMKQDTSKIPVPTTHQRFREIEQEKRTQPPVTPTFFR